MKNYELPFTFCRRKMFLHLFASLVGMLAVVAFAPVSANAQLCSVTAGTANYTIPATSHYDTSQASNLTGVGNGDYLFEDGWWFRVSGDAQESFFPTPTTTACAGSAGTITWTDVNGRGAFSAINTLNITSAGANQGVLTLTMAITNSSTVSPLTISLFHGADFDVNGSAASDTATLLLPNTHLRITDVATGFAEYRASAPFANGFLVRAFAASTDVFGLLGDATVTTFDNSGLPFANADFTGGYQWNLTIPPAGTSSVTIEMTGNTNLSPVTAANVSVGGRVLADKSIVSRATVTLTDENGATRTATTNSFGNFRFDDVEAGRTYVFTVQHKLYRFEPRVLTLNEAAELDFTALPE
ncbi:MAG TPA: carboxypeptidase-like regulatory domain-containing protein [Pyrinomonadaceae bacterium]|nr:carboxypeptidase-like regulatory domain-containing protein [Pyrinomonadaceae bacterium]